MQLTKTKTPHHGSDRNQFGTTRLQATTTRITWGICFYVARERRVLCDFDQGLRWHHVNVYRKHENGQWNRICGTTLYISQTRPTCRTSIQTWCFALPILSQSTTHFKHFTGTWWAVSPPSSMWAYCRVKSLWNEMRMVNRWPGCFQFDKAITTGK